MRILQMFGIGEKRILTGGNCVDGKVIKVKTCHWLKINTNHVRLTPLDGAKFPHIIHFTYTVRGKEYTGSRYVNWYFRCPVKDEHITVYFDAENPAKYAVEIT